MAANGRVWTRKGKLIVITGPVRSGKTKKLLEMLAALEQETGFPAVALANAVRYGKPPAELLADYAPFAGRQHKDPKITGMDDVHYLLGDPREFADFISRSKRWREMTWVIAGCDRNLDAQPAPMIVQLLGWADEVIRLETECTACRGLADMTRVFVDGRPVRGVAPWVTGDRVRLEPRCRDCYLKAL